jgi:adenylate cyclase
LLLTAEATVAAAGDALEVREIDRIALLGQSRAQSVYKTMGVRGALTPNQIELRARYAAGLAAYRNRRWEEAREAFTAALEAMPDDGPTLTMLKRIATPGRGAAGGKLGRGLVSRPEIGERRPPPTSRPVRRVR